MVRLSREPRQEVGRTSGGIKRLFAGPTQAQRPLLGPGEKSHDVRVKSPMRRVADFAPFAQTKRPSLQQSEDTWPSGQWREHLGGATFGREA